MLQPWAARHTQEFFQQGYLHKKFKGFRSHGLRELEVFGECTCLWCFLSCSHVQCGALASLCSLLSICWDVYCQCKGLLKFPGINNNPHCCLLLLPESSQILKPLSPMWVQTTKLLIQSWKILVAWTALEWVSLPGEPVLTEMGIASFHPPFLLWLHTRSVLIIYFFRVWIGRFFRLQNIRLPL